MLFWLDCEFIEDGGTIDLISIALVAEDDREYYAINEDCDFSKASDWVLEKVLVPMGLGRRGFHEINTTDPSCSPKQKQALLDSKSRQMIKSEVADFMGFVGERIPLEPTGITKLLLKLDTRLPNWAIKLLSVIGIHPSIKTKIIYRLVESTPEIWGEYCAYDWVAFCQLFGRMLDLPEGMPFLCKDIVLLMEQEGLTYDNLPPKSEDQHNALADAWWVKSAWEAIQAQKELAEANAIEGLITELGKVADDIDISAILKKSKVVKGGSRGYPKLLKDGSH